MWIRLIRNILAFWIRIQWEKYNITVKKKLFAVKKNDY